MKYALEIHKVRLYWYLRFWREHAEIVEEKMKRDSIKLLQFCAADNHPNHCTISTNLRKWQYCHQLQVHRLPNPLHLCLHLPALLLPVKQENVSLIGMSLFSAGWIGRPLRARAFYLLLNFLFGGIIWLQYESNTSLFGRMFYPSA